MVAAGAAAHHREGAAHGTGPPLRPQGCSASLSRRPAAGLDPGASAAPGRQEPRARRSLPPGPARGTRPPPALDMVNTGKVIYRHCCDDPLNPRVLEPPQVAVLTG